MLQSETPVGSSRFKTHHRSLENPAQNLLYSCPAFLHAKFYSIKWYCRLASRNATYVCLFMPSCLPRPLPNHPLTPCQQAKPSQATII